MKEPSLDRVWSPPSRVERLEPKMMRKYSKREGIHSVLVLLCEESYSKVERRFREESVDHWPLPSDILCLPR